MFREQGRNEHVRVNHSKYQAFAPAEAHFSCLPVGLWMQPEPLEVEPHQMHLLPPGP